MQNNATDKVLFLSIATNLSLVEKPDKNLHSKLFEDMWDEEGHPDLKRLQLYEVTLEKRLYKVKHKSEIESVNLIAIYIPKKNHVPHVYYYLDAVWYWTYFTH